jgi:nicotinamidase/pyrazinamidase
MVIKCMTKKIVVPEECALIVEDMQKDFCNEDGALFIGDRVNEIIARISRLIERAIGKKVHLIFAQDWHSPDDDEFEIWGQHCVRETPGAEVIDVFAPLLKEAHIIRKQRYSDFFGTDLDAHLKEKGIRILIIVGVATNICVMHTAIDATHRGYELIVPADCVAAFSDHEHEYGLLHIKTILKGTITSSGDIIFSG